MPGPASKLEAARDAIVDALRRPGVCPALDLRRRHVSDSSILAWKKGDKIAGTTARIKALGVSVVVMVTSAKESGDQSVQAHFDRVPILIAITEKVVVNQGASGSQLSALYIAERCIANLKDAQLPGLDYLITTDPQADAIQDANPFRSLFVQDEESAFNAQFVNLLTKITAEQRDTP